MENIKQNVEERNINLLQNKYFKIILIAFIIIIKCSSSCLYKNNNINKLLMILKKMR